MDLTKLSRDQKEQLLTVLKQKEVKKKEAILDTFSPIEWQKKFLKSKARIRAAFCANGTGKTTALTMDLIWTHLRRHKYRDTDKVRHSWLLVPGLDKAQDYCEELKRWCPPSLLPTFNKLGSANIRRFEWADGSYTTIYSHDQDSGKLEGTNIDALFCDEPPPRALWVAAFRGLRNNPDYFVALAGTPLSAAWMYQEIYLPWANKTNPNVEVFQASIFDNPYLSKDFIEDFSSRLTEDEKRVRLYGEFAALQGRIFKEFNRMTHVIEPQTWPKDWPVYMAIDPHSRKKSTAVWVGVTPDDDLIVIDEIAGDDIPDLGRKIKALELSKGYKIVMRRIDNSGSDRGWKSESAIDILRQEGIRVSPMRNAEKAVMDGIIRMRKLMTPEKCTDGSTRPRLQVMEHCRGVIMDLEMYGWDEARNEETAGVKEKPKKVNDDYIDPIRYIVMSRPRYGGAMGIIYTSDKPYGQPESTTESRIETDPQGRTWR